MPQGKKARRPATGKPAARGRAAVRQPAARGAVDDATGRTLDWRGRQPALRGKRGEVAAWIARELREQEKRYRRIVREMNALESRRQRWIRDFYARLQDTGFNLHADIKRRIPPEAIPALPKKVRVVF